MTDRPDFSELIHSPYDDDTKTGGVSFLVVIVPIAALVLGGLVGTAIAGSNEPVDASADVPGSTTTTVIAGVASEPATGFPEGFTEVSDDVAVQVVRSYTTAGNTSLVVTGVTDAAADRESTFMQSFGDWVIRQSGNGLAMVSQAANGGAPGMLQIQFDGEVEPGAVLVGTPVQPTAPVTVRLFDDASTEMVIDEPIVLDVDGTEVVIDQLQYNLTEGRVAWHSAPDAPAMVEIMITLVGTEGLGTPDSLPIRVGTFDSWSALLGEDLRADVPTWNTRGESHFRRSGPFRFDQNLIEEVTVDAIITLATEPGEPVEIPIP